MIRKIIRIDEEKCNGCGLCADACHEGAIEMVDGKAKLTREDYCDGLGDCLPACPTGAITFEEREAPAYDQSAVLAAKEQKMPLPCGCPGTNAKAIHREAQLTEPLSSTTSQLSQWPVQIKLAPVNAPYFENAVKSIFVCKFTFKHISNYLYAALSIFCCFSAILINS